jgi:hypothetical protein
MGENTGCENMRRKEYEKWLKGRIKACQNSAEEYEARGDQVQSALEYTKGHTFLICLKTFKGEEE